MNLSLKLPLLLSLCWASTSMAADFALTSKDISLGTQMSKAQEFQGFGCNGENISPHLAWSKPPEGTKSFALTVFDPDAPTGSGWWHWQLVNIPISVSELARGSGEPDMAPPDARHIENDYGFAGFGGACPPPGHGEHRYRFTIHALAVEKLELPANASGALAGYMINANSIASATIESLYQRD